MKKEYNYKLNKTLYYDEDAESIYDYCDTLNGKNEYKLFARKGTLFKKIQLTDEIREEFCIDDDELDYIFVSKNNNWISDFDNTLLNEIKEVEEI